MKINFFCYTIIGSRRFELSYLVIPWHSVISLKNGNLILTFVSTGMFPHLAWRFSNALRIILSLKRHFVGSHLLECPMINVWKEITIPSETGGKRIELGALFYLRHDLQHPFSYFIVIFHFCCLLISAVCFRFPWALSFPCTKAAKIKETEPSACGFRRQWSRGSLAVILGLLWVITAVPFPVPRPALHTNGAFLWFQIPLPQEFRW